VDVLMPQLGETVAEGKITKWFVKPGTAVKPGDNLFEIETDKVSMEVPSITAGTLSEIRVPEGEVAKVGAIVAVISADGSVALSGAAASGAPPAPTASAPVPQTQASSKQRGDASPPFVPAQAGTQGQELGPRFRGDERSAGRADFSYEKLDPFFEVRTPSRNFGPARLPGGASVTPLARRLATESGIDLSAIKPSGAHGRIVARDVERTIGTAAPVQAMATGASAAQVKAIYQDVPYEEVPLDGMRATIARRLVEAKQTVPHFYLTTDVETDKLLAFREEANSGAPQKNSEPTYKLSVNDFIIKAMALALQRVPAANAVWAGDRILRFKQSDIGVAVAIEGGLLTPVIRNAEGKSLSAISNEMRDLAARARAKKLKPAEYQGGSSAISNLGMYGVREFAAIINPPHSTILAVGAAQRRPTEAADGGVKFVSQMTVTLSCDHRVVDGALGAELLAAFKSLLESPVRMLV
jgi:pyruvate dehydrogenase E2 component (dihydrolipoamide acetyltransferase)